MSSKTFNWHKNIADIMDESSGIPPDVVFQIEEEDQLHEVKAHKMILGMVSPMFKKMFFTTDVGDKTSKEVKIKETTKLAFQIMLDAIYDTKSIEDSLKDKSVHEIFDVVNLTERYQIAELVVAIEKHLSNFAVTDNTVLEVAAEAMQYKNLFQKETQHLLLICAKFLQPKLKDAKSIFRYAAENQDHKEEVATLLALINDIAPTVCHNCGYEKCKHLETVKKHDFREGLIVTNNRACSNYWSADWGTGKVKSVTDTTADVVSIKPGARQNVLIMGNRFNGSGYIKVFEGLPSFLFFCK